MNSSEPLSATDVHSPNDGSKVQVAYQIQLMATPFTFNCLWHRCYCFVCMVEGLLGAYSEIAALKAYPKCETIPCNDFKAAF